MFPITRKSGREKNKAFQKTMAPAVIKIVHAAYPDTYLLSIFLSFLLQIKYIIPIL
jgi:hypothetical protein